MSAINWDSLSEARRLQGLLQRYFDLLDQVRAMEEDPDLRAALAGLGEKTENLRPQEPKPAARPLKANRSPHDERTASGRILGIATKYCGDGELEFDANVLLDLIASDDPELRKTLSEKQVNDHLRRLAMSGAIRLTTPGKRGTGGRMPMFKVSGGSAA